MRADYKLCIAVKDARGAAIVGTFSDTPRANHVTRMGMVKKYKFKTRFFVVHVGHELCASVRARPRHPGK